MKFRLVWMTLISVSMGACHPASSPIAETSLEGAAGIVGGKTAAADEPGFASTVKVVSNGIEGSSDCSGTLISPRLVLTAAHCLPEDLRELPLFHNEKFKLGTVTFAAAPGETRAIQDFVVHEKYLSGDINFPKIGDFYYPVALNDVALVLLDGDAPAKAKVAPYRKSIETVDGNAVDVVAMGYGATDGVKKDKPTGLRRASMRGYLKPEFKAKIYFDQSAGKGTCYGDSGGPIYYMNKADHGAELVGVISQLTGPFKKTDDGDYVPVIKASDPCKMRSFAVEVGEYLQWIDDNSPILIDHQCNKQNFFTYAALYAGIQLGYEDLDGTGEAIVSDPSVHGDRIDWNVSAVMSDGKRVNYVITSLLTCQVVHAERLTK